MVAGEAGGFAGASPSPEAGPPRASASRKSDTSPGVASSADWPRSSRNRPYCNRSVRYASRVLRESPRSNSRYARKSSTRCSKRRSTRGCSIVATVRISPQRAAALWLQSAVQEGPQPEQAHERLRVVRVADCAVQVGEGPFDDLDALVLVRVGRVVVEVGRHEQVAFLVGEAG